MVPDRYDISTRSVNREDYILHPESGETLSDVSSRSLANLKQKHDNRFNVQIVISDGLNAHSIMDEGHLSMFLRTLRDELSQKDFRSAKENILIRSGRVRAGYRIGEAIFGGSNGRRAILHVIGERPGTGHHTFSVYITSAFGSDWAKAGTIDHNITKVVSGIASTALLPRLGAIETVRVLTSLV